MSGELNEAQEELTGACPQWPEKSLRDYHDHCVRREEKMSVAGNPNPAATAEPGTCITSARCYAL